MILSPGSAGIAGRTDGEEELRGILNEGVRIPDAVAVLRQLLRKRTKLELADEHLGSFGLEQDLAAVRCDLGGAVHDGAVDEIGERIFGGVAVDARPLLARAVDVFFAADAEGVFPVGIASVPVDAALGESLLLAAGFPAVLAIAVFLDFAEQAASRRFPFSSSPCRTRMSPTPPSITWNSIDVIHGPGLSFVPPNPPSGP